MFVGHSETVMERRRDSDPKKTKAAIDAGLKLVRWHVKSPPDEAAIQWEIIQKDPARSALPSTDTP